MQDLFEISSSTGSHGVRIVGSSLAETIAFCAPTLVIADNFFRGALTDVASPMIFIEALETSKDMSKMPALVEACRRHGLTRNGSIAAVGGGVIQDIACFIASVYMRGVRWTYVPTTLLAMVDSCIGGKSSINVGDFKNLVGTFYPPSSVVIPPAVLATLPPEHIAAGRLEAAKICFARSEAAFDDYLAVDRGPWPRDAAELIEISLRAKKWFVEVDEFDRNERLLLNFGHSFGHALESCSDYAVPHGVAVGVGCLAAMELSRDEHPALAECHRVAALRAQLLAILAPLDGLGDVLAGVGRTEFFRYFDSDKKHTRVSYRPVLIGQDSRLLRDEMVRDDKSADRIWDAFLSARETIAAMAEPVEA